MKGGSLFLVFTALLLQATLVYKFPMTLRESDTTVVEALFLENPNQGRDFNVTSTMRQVKNSTAAVDASTGEHKVLIFIHYHKSGHDLSRLLAKTINPEGARLFRKSSPRYNIGKIRSLLPSRNESRGQLIKNSLLVLPPIPELVLSHDIHSWKSLFPSTSVRVVHFVRDPLDMVISAYLYHSQVPPPAEEGPWLTTVNDNPCDVLCQNGTSAQYVLATQVGLNPTLMAHFRNQCEAYHKDDEMGLMLSHHEALQRLSMKDGIRLTTLHSLCKHLLLMWNGLKQSESLDNGQIYTTMLDQWTTSAESFEHTARIVCLMLPSQILNHHHDSSEMNLWHTIDECVNTAKDECFLGKYENKQQDTSTHVTRHRLSHQDRSHLKTMLLNDAFFGETLTMIQSDSSRIWKQQFKALRYAN